MECLKDQTALLQLELDDSRSKSQTNDFLQQDIHKCGAFLDKMNELELISDMQNVQSYLNMVSANFVTIYRARKRDEECVRILEAFDKFPDLTREIENQVALVLSLQGIGPQNLGLLYKNIEMYHNILATLGNQYCQHLKNNLQSILSMLFNNLTDFIIQSNKKNELETRNLAIKIIRIISADIQTPFISKSQSHLQMVMNNEKGQLKIRTNNLDSFSKSFFLECKNAETSYTFLFSESVGAVLKELTAIRKSESFLKIFAEIEQDQELKLKFYRSLEENTLIFIQDVLKEFMSFFQFNFESFAQNTKEMFILVDHPYQKQKKEGIADRFDINKLEIFITEFSQILQFCSNCHFEMNVFSDEPDSMSPDQSVFHSNSNSHLLQEFNLWILEQIQFIKSIAEIVTKLQLIITVRESVILRFIFFSNQEPQCLYDIEKEFFKSSFANFNFSKTIQSNAGILDHADLNFSRFNEWIYTIFYFLEAMVKNILTLVDEKSILSFLSFVFNVILNKDVKNLMIKLTEAAIRNDLFAEDAFHLEPIPKIIKDPKAFSEQVKDIVEKKQSKKTKVFSRHNLIFSCLLNMFETVISCIEKFKTQIKKLIQETKIESAQLENTINDLDVVAKDFFFKKNVILKEFTEKCTEIFAFRHFEKFRNMNLASIRYNEVQIFDEMIDEIGQIYECFEIYFNEESFLSFKNISLIKLIKLFRETIALKSYNLQGSNIVKQEYLKLKEIVMLSCGHLNELRAVNFQIELLSSMDKDYFDNFSVFALEHLSEKEISEIRKSRIDFSTEK